MSSPSGLVELLNESSAPYRDPLPRLNWEGLDLDIWWLPPQALSLNAVPAFQRLPLALRRRLSHFEFAWLLEAGLWLEALFIEKLGGALDAMTDLKLRGRYLHEIREEAGHSLMFIELIRRSGVRIPEAARYRPWLARRLARRLDACSPLFWALVVIGEELPDKLNRMVRNGVADATVSSLVYHMTTLHIIDEARHIAHARAVCSETSEALPAWKQRLASPLLSRALRDFVRFLFYPPAALYALAGLPAGQDWRALARRNPHRRQLALQAATPTAEFLRSAGWSVRSPHV
jgi:para-aminobenzoate N-oxygenase AurF